MRCPKCGLTSFDYNEACPNCRRNLTSLREELGLLDVAPQSLFFLGPLLSQEEPGGDREEAEAEDFTFEPSESEHLATYDGDSSGIQEDEVSVEDMEEVSTLEFEAGSEEKEEGTGLEIQSEGEVEFEMPAEELSLSAEGADVETPDQPLDLAVGEQTLVLEPDNSALQLELEAETEIESSGQEVESLDLGLEPADEVEPLKALDDDLDLASLDVEPEDLDLSDIELETEDAETSDLGAPDEIAQVKPDDLEPELEIELVEEESESLELNLDSADEDEPLETEEDELDLASLDIEPEDLDLSDIELETEDVETTDFGDSEETLIMELEETPPADISPGASETDISSDSEPLEDLEQEAGEGLKGLGSMDLGIETEEETPGDEEDFNLPGLDIDQEDLMATDEDEFDDQDLTASTEAEFDDMESHLDDETLIIEDTDETLILENSAINEDTDETLVLENSAESESPIFQESEDEEDLDEIELDFDDLELELEEDD